MGENTAIEWCDHTMNFWIGCTKVSPACDHCYAESYAKRIGQPELWAGERRRTAPSNWNNPHKWNRHGGVDYLEGMRGSRPRVFANSLSDFMDNQVPVQWRRGAWHVIDQTPNLDWLILTKRPQNIIKMLPEPDDGYTKPWGPNGWPNVWFGTTVENQEEAERRIPHLVAAPCALRYLSMEPLLGSVYLRHSWLGWKCCIGGRAGTDEACGDCDPCIGSLGKKWIDWIIVGGESGGKARPMNPQWVRAVRDQCKASGVAFFHKQNGEYASVSEVEGNGAHFRFPDGRTVRRVGKKAAGRLLDGIEHSEWPRGVSR